MGNEIKRDMCPEKYCSTASVFKDSISTMIALVIVAVFSGSFFNESGLDIAVTIIIEVTVVALFYGLIFILFKGMKKRLAETYISVCENGICGVCPMNGFKNRTFQLSYDEINKMVVKGERLFLYSQKGNVALTLNDAPGTAELIKAKNTSL